MNEFFLTLFFWVSIQMGVDPKTFEVPTFQAVDTSEMAIVICGAPVPQCPISPATYDGETLSYIQDLDFMGNREYASFVVHHLVHFIQFVKVDKKGEEMIKKLPEYEEEAMVIQRKFLSLTDVNLK